MVSESLTINKLIKEGYSFALLKDGKAPIAFKYKGIKPILEDLAIDRTSFENSSVADRIVGKAVALLFVFGNVKSVYAYVISDCAKDILEKNNINVDYNHIVPYIMNESGDDKCPLEKIVEDIDDADEAFSVFKNLFNV